MEYKKKGKGIQLVFNFSERALYSAIAILIVLILGVGVYAVAGTTPNLGTPHEQIQPCSNGEILKISNGVWSCGSDAGIISETQNLSQVLTQGANANNKEIVNVNGIRIGSASSPGSWSLYSGGNIYIAGYLRLNNAASFPSCDSSNRGVLILYESSNKDTLWICYKSSSSSYGWSPVGFGL
ncbi:MAG: hypothetical protein AABY03_01730 [Nanoarchaeota archaeon]